MKLNCLAYLLLCASLLTPFAAQGGARASSSPATPVVLRINDYYILYTAPRAPYIDSHGRMMVPLRMLHDLLGATIGYDAQTRSANVAINARTVVFRIGSKTITVDGVESPTDTAPILDDDRVLIPLSILIRHVGIDSSWSQANRLYSLTGSALTRTGLIANYADLDHREPVQSTDVFRPLSYTLDISDDHYAITIRSRHVSGTDVPKGLEDVNPYFIFDHSAVLDYPYRQRPAVPNGGVTEYTWAFMPTIVDGDRETLGYIVAEGRLLSMPIVTTGS